MAQEASAVQEALAALAGQEDQGALAAQVGLAAQAVPAASAARVESAAQAGPAARAALAVQVGRAARKRAIVPPRGLRPDLAAAPDLPRGQAAAGREARRWAASEWAAPTRPSPIAAR